VFIDPIKGKIRKLKKKKKGSIELKLLWELERAACSEELVLDEGSPATYPCCWRRRAAPASSSKWVLM